MRRLGLLSLCGGFLLIGTSLHPETAEEPRRVEGRRPEQKTSGNQTPKERCHFEGFDTTFNLAEIARSTDGYVLCPPGGGCRPSPQKSGEPIVVYRIAGDWTCAALPGGPGWVLSKDIQRIAPEPRPLRAAWLGTWEGGAGRVTIRQSNTRTGLTLEGSGSWEGGNGVVHTGKFSGEAVPDGNRLHFVQEPCVIDLVLFGKYILADDNSGCGGMNVRFSGIWKHRIVRR